LLLNTLATVVVRVLDLQHRETNYEQKTATYINILNNNILREIVVFASSRI